MEKDLKVLQNSLGKVIEEMKLNFPTNLPPLFNPLDTNILHKIQLQEAPKINSLPSVLSKNNKELLESFNAVYEEIKKINDNADQAETINKDRYEKSIELSDKSLKIAKYSLFASIILGISSIITPIIQSYISQKPNSEQTVPLSLYNDVLQRIQAMELQLKTYKPIDKEKSKKLNKSEKILTK